MSNLDGEQQAVRALRLVLKERDEARAEVERLRALDKEAKSAFAPWVQGPGIVGGILHLQEEVERLRAEANARAVEELHRVQQWVMENRVPAFGSTHMAVTCAQVKSMVAERIAELSKPAAKESEPVKDDHAKCWSCGGQGYITTASDIAGMVGYSQYSCSRCGGTGKLHYVTMEQLKDGDPAKPEEPDWTVAMEEKAEQILEDNDDEASTTVRLLFQVVKAICNLGREVRRGGKS